MPAAGTQLIVWAGESEVRFANQAESDAWQALWGISHRQRERSSPLLRGQDLFEKSLAENHLPPSGRRCASPAGSRQVPFRGDFQGAVSLRQKTVSRPRTRRRPRDNAGVAMQVSPMVFFANSRYSGPAAST